MSCQEATDTSQRAARTHADDDSIDIALHLAKDFWSGCSLAVGERCAGVGATAPLLDSDVAVETIAADLNNKADLARIETTLRTNTSITAAIYAGTKHAVPGPRAGSCWGRPGSGRSRV
jgi:hypothetical protein